MQSVRDLECSALSGMFMAHFSCREHAERLQEPKVADIFKESILRHHMADIDCDSVHKTCISSSQTRAQQGGQEVGTKYHP